MNPLKLDPTRTTLLRNKFSADVVRRFNQLKKNIRMLFSEVPIHNYLKPHVKYGYDKNRPNAVARGYTYKWHKARAEYFKLHPWCVQCAKEGRKTKATNLDHIKKHGGDQKIFWDKSNWQGLCHSCHSKKTRTNNELTINDAWQFNSNPDKIEAFRNWLQSQLAYVSGERPTDNDWWNEYILQGYAKGAGRAYQDVKNAGQWNKEQGAFYSGTKEEFLRSSFAQPAQREKVKLLTSRVFTDLKGITDTMSQQLVRTLADGLVTGMGPRQLAKELSDRVDKIGITRANAMARTEIIRAHAEGQLDAFKNMGVEEIGVAVEWSTAGFNVCPKCQALQGIVLKVDEAHGMIPRHPNCKCSFIPANVGESKKDQIDTKTRIEAAIRASIGKDKKDKWVGASLSVSKKRPESLV